MHRPAAACKPESGNHNKKRTPNFFARVRGWIERNPIKSMRNLAKDLEANKKTIRMIVKMLGLKSYVHRERQLLTKSGKEKRLARLRILVLLSGI